MAARFTNLGEVHVEVPAHFDWRMELGKNFLNLFSPHSSFDRRHVSDFSRSLLDRLPTEHRFLAGRRLRAKLFRPSVDVGKQVSYEEILAFTKEQNLVPGGMEGLILLWKVIGVKKLPRLNFCGVEDPLKLARGKSGEVQIPMIEQTQGYWRHTMPWLTEERYHPFAFLGHQGAILAFEIIWGKV